MFLADKHALVTGGGTGIGLAIAQALASEGASVTVSGRRTGPLSEAASSSDRIFPLEMDVSDPNSITTGVAKANAERGPIAITVANAGIAVGRSLAKMDLEFWRQTMSTNLDGAFLTIRATLATLEREDWGRVIAVSSVAGLRGLRGAPAYTASKHGLVGLIRGLSEDYMGSEITFNALCPGYVDTPIIDQNVRAISERTGLSEDKARAIMIESNPHKKLIDPKDVAAAAVWLCGPGSASINGQAIEIFGGQV